jgi:hypothetical protein
MECLEFLFEIAVVNYLNVARLLHMDHEKKHINFQVALKKILKLLTHSSLILLRSAQTLTLQPHPSYSNNREGSWTLVLLLY